MEHQIHGCASICATADSFKDLPGILGYEPFNEPHPGLFKKKEFEETYLKRFYENVIKGVAAVDPDSSVFIEPRVDWTVFGYKKDEDDTAPWDFINDPASQIVTYLPDVLPGNKTVFSFHYYDPRTALHAGLGKTDDMSTKAKKWSEVFAVILAAAAKRNLIPFMTEYGPDYNPEAWCAPAKVNSDIYPTQSAAYMDLSLQQIEANLLNSTLWVFDLYSSLKDHDNWNQEDGSLLNYQHQIHYPEIVARPYPMRSSVEPILLFFNSFKKHGAAMFKGTPVTSEPTVSYVPDMFYQNGFEVHFTSGQVDWDGANHLLYWNPDAGQTDHQIVVCPRDRLDKSALPQASQDLLSRTTMVFQSP